MANKHQRINVFSPEVLKAKVNSKLVLYNDDDNTFEYVISCLVNYCGHDLIQAEQCVYLIHLLGSYPVLLGNKDVLRPVCEWLNDLGLITAVVPIIDKE